MTDKFIEVILYNGARGVLRADRVVAAAQNENGTTAVWMACENAAEEWNIRTPLTELLKNLEEVLK